MSRTYEVREDQAAEALSRLLHEVERGNEIVITRMGRPIARLIPVEHIAETRTLGLDRGMFEIPDDFDAPLSCFVADD